MKVTPTTVGVRVEFDPRSKPGEIAVLLDLLEGARLPSTWHIPPDTDPALLDRLYFGGHASFVIDRGTPDSTAADSPAASGQDADAHDWLRDVQISIGRALEQGTEWELRIETAALQRPDNISAVAEALDLIAGLVRAGRLRVVPQLD